MLHETSEIDIRVHAGHRWLSRLPRHQWLQAISVSVSQTQWIMVYHDPTDFEVFDKAIRSERPGLQSFPGSGLKLPERPLHIISYLRNALSVAPGATQHFLDVLNLGRYVHDNNDLALNYFKDQIADWKDAAEGTLLHYAAGSGKQVQLVANHCTVSLRDRFGLHPCHVAAAVGNQILSHQLNNTGQPISSDLSDIDVPLQYRKSNNTRRALILVNPISGKGCALRVFKEAVSPMLDVAGVQYEMIETSRLDEATEIALSFDISKYDTIMCISGDGILHEVLQGISRRRGDGDSCNLQRFPIVVIPAGSGNATVCSHSGPTCSPVDVMKKFIQGCYTAADLIEVFPIGKDTPAEKQSIFAIVSFAWGLLSDVDFESESMRCLGALRFSVMAVIRLLIRKKYICKIRYRSSDSEEFSQVLGNIDFFVAANMPYLAPDMRIAPSAKIDDGKIHLCFAQGKSSLGMISMLACDVEAGTHTRRAGIVYVTCTELIIEPISENSIFDADGERCYFKAAHCFLRPASASIIA